MKTKTKKRIAGAVAVASAAALILTGTFAWIDFDQHKTNPFAGSLKPSVTLNNKFTAPPTWTPFDPPVDNKVSVTNNPNSNAPVLVRVRFKEYLRAYNLKLDAYITENVSGVDKPILFATYANGPKIGEYLSWDTQAAADAWRAAEGALQYTIYGLDTDGVAGDDIWFARTENAELRNGIYGKAMLHPVISNEEVALPNMLFGGVPHINYEQNMHQSTEESYRVHRWEAGAKITNYAPFDETTTEANAKAISNYVRWTMGADSTPYEPWKAAGANIANKWVLAADGWCYWMNALHPDSTTANVMEKVKLIDTPSDALDYEIHVDMESITFDELGKEWLGIETPITDALNQIKAASTNRLALGKLIKEVEALDPTNYTDASWLALQAQLTASKDIYNDSEASATALADATADLKASKTALVLLVPARDLLIAAITEARRQRQTDWDDTTWTDLQTKIRAAELVRDNASATNEQVEAALTSVNDAIAALRADKVALNALVAECQTAVGAGKGDYSHHSWDGLTTALTEAIRIKDLETAKNSDANAAKEALEKAKAGLLHTVTMANGERWLVFVKIGTHSLIMSEDVLAASQFHNAAPYPTWESSDLRAYLNSTEAGGFIDSHFNAAEISKLRSNAVSTPTSIDDPTPSVTTDTVYILTAAEMTDYLDTEYSRMATNGGTPSNWWLRNPASDENRVGIVQTDGVIVSFRPTINGGVRPVVWMELD